MVDERGVEVWVSKPQKERFWRTFDDGKITRPNQSKCGMAVERIDMPVSVAGVSGGSAVVVLAAVEVPEAVWVLARSRARSSRRFWAA